MQAAPVRPRVRPLTVAVAAEEVARRAAAAHRARARVRPALPSVSAALRIFESLLLSGGQRTARRNAWSAVLEDRSRARDRAEAQEVLEAVSDPTSQAT